MFSISADSERYRRGHTSPPVVRAEIQTNCNLKAYICDFSDLLGYALCYFDIVPLNRLITPKF